MPSLQNLKVRKKLWLIIGSALAGIAVIISMSLIFLQQDLKQEKELKTRHLVENAYSVLEYYHKLAKEGKIPEQEAKTAAIAMVKALRYEGKEYFWINDMKPVMVMHPYKPELDGKDLSDFKDPKGNKLFVAFVDKVREKKAGFVYYLWPKPGASEPVEKVSYVKGFEPWGWVIGSGIYIDDLQANFIRSSINYAAVAVAISVIIIFMSWLVARNINRGLAALTERINMISDGDLRITVDNDRKDEFGVLGRDIGKMADTLNKMINEIFGSVNKVVHIVDMVKAKTEDTANAARNQAVQASEIATAAEEMNQTINDVARNSVIAAETSAEAMITALDGKKVAAGAVETVDRVYRATIDLSGMIEKLNLSAGEIGDIVTVINDIADQTNLLALNASIEAARAGEYGRGFAVVADEVRKLAERTIKATSEISKKIGAVQKESTQTTKSMSEATSEVTKATEFIKDVGETLNHIVDAVQKSRDQITQIATAVEQQSATAEEIAANIEQTLVAAKQMETKSEEVKTAVYELGSIDEEMRNSTSGFKTHISGMMMLDLAKTDHRIFVNKLGNCLHTKKKVDVAQMPDHHSCRFGKWYDGEGKEICGTATSFRAIDAPHERIHAIAREAAIACNSGDRAKAEKLYEQVESISHEIVDLLEKIKTECSSSQK